MQRPPRALGRSLVLAVIAAVLLAAAVGAYLAVRGAAAAPAATSAHAADGARGHVLQVRPAAGHRGLRVGVVGDSLAYGYYASGQSKTWTGLVRTALGRYGPVSEEVDAGPGETTAEALGRAIPAGADLVVVELGTNDVKRNTGAAFGPVYRRLLERIVQESPTAALLCLEPWGGQAEVASYSAEVDRLCRAAGGEAATISGIYSAPGDRAKAGVAFFDGTSRDDFHPGDRGHAAIANLIVSMVHVTR